MGVALLAFLALAANSAELRIGQTNVSAGASAIVPVICDSATGAVAAQFDFSYDASLVSLTGISGGSALAEQVLDYQQLAPGHWRALVYSLADSPISAGTLVWLSFDILPNTGDGVIPLTLGNTIASRPAGQPVQPLTQTSGALVISTPPDSIMLRFEGANQVVVTVSGVQGRIFTLQGSPDLIHWADLGTYTNQTGTLVVPCAVLAERPAYFYRTMFWPTGSAPASASPNLRIASRLLRSAVGDGSQ